VAITFVGSDVGGGNVATIAAGDLVWPAVQADDVALLFWTFQNTATPTTPSGFTLVTNNDGGSGSMRTYIYKKVCTGSEDGTDVGCTLSAANRQSACIVVYRGVDTANPVDGTPSVDTSHSTGTTHNNPAYTPTVNNTVILTSIHERATSIDTAWTPPSGYTERADSLTEATGSGGTITAVADDGLAAGRDTSSVTPPVWTGDHGTGTPNIVTYTLALRSGASDATATPAVVAGTASVPAPTVSGGATAQPAAVAAVASVPAVAVVAETRVQPAAVAAVASVPAPSLSTSTTQTPSTVVAVADVPALTVSGGATATPAAVAAVATVPAPTVLTGTNATVQPATVAATATVPAPNVAVTSIAAPAAVAAVASVPAPDVVTSTAVPASVVTATASVPTPAVSVGTTQTPSAVTAVADIPQPGISVGFDVGTVAVAASVPAPTVSASGGPITPATTLAAGETTTALTAGETRPELAAATNQ